MWYRPTHKNRRRAHARNRGIALIMVLTAIAIFTAVVVDFTYSSRVELDLAANARDEVRAYFLAKSAFNLSRLVIHFQRELDKSPLASSNPLGALGGAGGALGNLLGGAGGAGGALAGIPGLSGGLNIQLYKLIPVDSGMIQLFLGGAGSSAPMGQDDFFQESDAKEATKASASTSETAPVFGEGDGLPGGKGKVKSFGDFQGSYHAEIEDEESKLNVARLNIPSGRIQQVAIMQSMLMFGDKRYEWLYDDEDANGVRTTAKDIIINMKDFIDSNQVASTMNPDDQVNPFVDGFSDETQPYSRYKPTYKPKNAPFDSLDELYRVDGVSDRFMAAFRDRLTVYPDINRAINVNTDDPFMMLMNIYLAANNPNDPNLQSPLTVQQILSDLEMTKMFPGMGMTVPQFVAILQANKVAVNPALTQNAGSNIRLSDRTETFSIHAEGDVGKVQKKLTAVVRSDNALGQLLYWREE
ncbi:MAG: general secretion pathway protein GspK [Deltaproteobacteria bacterium]|nr:general secretion pathway protein GspK [Deltaproteobacteria bacterium]